MDQPIVIKGRLERDDYVAAHLLALRRRRAILRLSLMVAGLAISLLDYIVGAGFLSVRFCQVAGAMVFFYGLVGTEVLLMLRLRRQFNRDPRSVGPALEMTFSEQGVALQGAGGAILPWSRLQGWREDGLNILVFFGRQRWFPVPKRLVPEGRLEDLRRLMSHHLGRRR